MDTSSAAQPELPPLPAELQGFADRAGRLRQWPARQKRQRAAIAWLATRFEAEVRYTEKQVNRVIQDWATVPDWVLIRRLLYDWGYLDREPDGRAYWLRAPVSHPGESLTGDEVSEDCTR